MPQVVGGVVTVLVSQSVEEEAFIAACDEAAGLMQFAALVAYCTAAVSPILLQMNTKSS